MSGPAAGIWLLAAALVVAPACRNSPGESTGTFGANTTGPTPLEFVDFNQQSWDRLTGNGWSYLRRGSSKDADVIQDATAPASPDRVLRMIFTPDMGRDREPGVHWIALPNAREVAAGWWIKLSANWTPSPAGGGKMTFLHTAPSGHGQVYVALFNPAAPHRVSVNTEWAPYGQRIWEPNQTATPFVYGRWYRIDWYMQWESAPGAGDGKVRWWVNGVLNGTYATLRFPQGATGFQQFEFAPTLQNPPPADQYMFVDHTYLKVR
jgi:hypothetical protein